MLTTCVDGLWILQVLSRLEVIAPELGLRPHLPSIETTPMAMAHPTAAELQSAGVIDGDGIVDRAVVEWLTVLSRRDISLLIHVQTPATEQPERILLARFAQWWVALERCGNALRVRGVGTALDEAAAGRLIRSEIDRLCGSASAASFRPMSLDADVLLREARADGSLDGFLRGQDLDLDQRAALRIATDRSRSAQLTIVATQAGVAVSPDATSRGTSAVTVIDTPVGRLTAERTMREDRDWLIVSPGSTLQVTAAVQRMLRSLPAESEWFSYRKAV